MRDFLKKEYRVKSEKDFQKVFHKGVSTANRQLVLYVYPKPGQVHYRVGFSVGKKIGNAVKRNKVKRQLKSIISKKDYQNNFNCIIIVGKGINERSFIEMKQNLLIAFNNLNILKENSNEKK